jgi:NTP pyrophosphatase (non-canonical NTP hydrolase)
MESTTRPWVNAFAQEMENKLAENRHKGDRDMWRESDPLDLFKRLTEEVDELANELWRPDIERNPERILRECADVGNFAMMIADVAGRLGGKTHG